MDACNPFVTISSSGLCQFVVPEEDTYVFLRLGGGSTPIPGAWSLWLLNFVQLRIIFVWPQYGTCFMSPFSCLEF